VSLSSPNVIHHSQAPRIREQFGLCLRLCREAQIAPGDFMRKLFACLLFSACVLGAADLTGTWSGSFDITSSNGETKADTAYMALKEKDGEVTGTAGPNEEKQWSLRKGKLEGEAHV
jgi:hypothetical protein